MWYKPIYSMGIFDEQCQKFWTQNFSDRPSNLSS